MSLKFRLLGVAGLLVILASASVWVVFQRIAEDIIEQWGRHLVSTQVRYDTARLLQPLEREIALSKQLTDSPLLKRWAVRPEDPALKAAAFEELESYRRNFRDQSWFIALLGSGAYYHNNARNEYAGRELRYTLNPRRPADAWFYQLVRQNKDFHLNVNPDAELGVTKVWIDVLLRDDNGKVLGVAGTGMDLHDFLTQIVDIDQPGIMTLYVDQSGAIQLHRDPALIDYASIVKPVGQKNTIDLLLDDPADSAQLQRIMRALRNTPNPLGQVQSGFVTVDGKRYLAGITYMPSIGWFEITLLNLDEVMPLNSFLPVALAFVLTLLVTLLLLHITLRHLLLDPLAALERAMLRVRQGDFEELSLPYGQAEVGRLIQHFEGMAHAIRDHTRHLENKVSERTSELERLTRLDPLTTLLNRRGMTERLQQSLDHARRQGHAMAVLWLDVDHFKEINDTLGHAVGDQALQAIAQVLRGCLRSHDQASRWGGDEFLVLLSAPCDEAALRLVGERIREEVARTAHPFDRALTVSIGAHLAVEGESLDQILQHADEALYAAKGAGRNVLKLYAETRSHTSQA